MLSVEVSFHFRKGDQEEGKDFYTLVTPGQLLVPHHDDHRHNKMVYSIQAV